MKKIIVLLVLILQYSNILGQTPRPMENYPSPNVANIGVFGNIPISMYTGSPNISIPIHEIKLKDISVPIQLDYNLASVKPNHHTSWVGMGWFLSAGGSITRRVRGTYDEHKYANGTEIGVYKHHEKLKYVHIKDSLEKYNKYFQLEKESEKGQEFELAVDEFSFNFCGYSGFFYLNSDGGWSVVSDDDIKIVSHEFISYFDLMTSHSKIKMNSTTDQSNWKRSEYNSRFFNKFTIRTPDGCLYTFGGKATEYSISYYNRISSDLIATTWHLIEIKSPNGQSVGFSYEEGAPICEIAYTPSMQYAFEGWVYSEDCLNIFWDSFGKSAMSGYLIFPTYLSSINSPNESIMFSTIEDIYESKPPRNNLGWIDSTPGFQRNFYNNRKYDPADKGFRLFLGINTAGTGKDLQNTLYDTFKWPALESITITYHNLHKTHHYNFEYIGRGRKFLNSIKESVTKFNVVELDSPPLDPPLVENKDGKVYNFDYYFPENNNPLLVFPELSLAREDMWGYFLGGKNNETSFENLLLQMQTPDLTYAKLGTLKEIKYPTGGKAVLDYELHDFSSCRSESIPFFNKGGGLRVKQISTYDENDQLTNIKEYKYTIGTTEIPGLEPMSSGILDYIPEYNMLVSIEITNDYLLKVRRKSFVGYVSQSTNNRIPTVGYTHVVEKKYDKNGNSEGYTIYVYNPGIREDGNPHNFQAGSRFDPFSAGSGESGKLLLQLTYNKSNKLIKSIRNEYAKVNDSYFNTVEQQLLIIGSCPLFNADAVLCSIFKTYTYSYLLKSTTESDYNPSTGDEMQSVMKEYEYNKNKLIHSETFTTSDGMLIKSEFRYPYDVVAGVKNVSIDKPLYPYYKLLEDNVLNRLIEKVVRKNDKVISVDINKYSNINVGNDQYRVLPIETYHLESNTPLSSYNKFNFYVNGLYEVMDPSCKLQVSYLKYDHYNNPIIIKDRTGEVVYLWSYMGQYPIAEIKNATYTDVASVLSESFINGLSDKIVPSDSDYEAIGALRRSLSEAMISTYTYKPLVGMTRATDPRGVTTYYDYDSFGRLKETYIMEGGAKKVVQAYDYHYQSQQ